MDGGRKSVTEWFKSKMKQVKRVVNRAGEDEEDEAEAAETFAGVKDVQNETLPEAEHKESEEEAEVESEADEAEDEDNEADYSQDEESETWEAEDEKSEEDAEDEESEEEAEDEESEEEAEDEESEEESEDESEEEEAIDEDEESEAIAWQRYLLWGDESDVEYSVGHVRDLAHSYTQLAAVATRAYKRFKEEEAKCSYRAWREAAGGGWRKEMMRNNGQMRSCLDRSIAHYRAALAKAQAAGVREAGRSVARNLLLGLSQLVARVRPHLKVAVYVEAAATFATTLELGGEDKAWLWPETRRGVVAVFEDMVEDLSLELSGMATSPKELVRAGEAVCRSLDRWSTVEESRAALGLLNLRIGEVVFNRWVTGKFS